MFRTLWNWILVLNLPRAHSRTLVLDQMVCFRGQQTYSVKGRIVNIGFMGHLVSHSTTDLCCDSGNAVPENMYRKEPCRVPRKPYSQNHNGS